MKGEPSGLDGTVLLNFQPEDAVVGIRIPRLNRQGAELLLIRDGGSFRLHIMNDMEQQLRVIRLAGRLNPVLPLVADERIAVDEIVAAVVACDFRKTSAIADND